MLNGANITALLHFHPEVAVEWQTVKTFNDYAIFKQKKIVQNFCKNSKKKKKVEVFHEMKMIF